MDKIMENPINLREATAFEHNDANFICDNHPADIVLVSETAFPGKISYYRGIKRDNGSLDSAGWIGVTK